MSKSNQVNVATGSAPLSLSQRYGNASVRVTITRSTGGTPTIMALPLPDHPDILKRFETGITELAQTLSQEDSLSTLTASTAATTLQPFEERLSAIEQQLSRLEAIVNDKYRILFV